MYLLSNLYFLNSSIHNFVSKLWVLIQNSLVSRLFVNVLRTVVCISGSDGTIRTCCTCTAGLASWTPKWLFLVLGTLLPVHLPERKKQLAGHLQFVELKGLSKGFMQSFSCLCGNADATSMSTTSIVNGTACLYFLVTSQEICHQTSKKRVHFALLMRQRSYDIIIHKKTNCKFNIFIFWFQNVTHTWLPNFAINMNTPDGAFDND